MSTDTIHSLTVTYTPHVMRKAVRHFWFRSIGRHLLVGFPICAGVCAALWISGDRSWVLGTCCTFTAISLLTSVQSYRIHLRNALAALKRMKSMQFHLTFSDDQISVASDLGKSEFSWRAIQKIWRFPDVWLLFTDGNSFFALPLAEIDPAIRSFIAEKVSGSGGSVW